MAEGKTQLTGSIFGPFYGPGMSSRGVGLEIPERDSDHSDPTWFQCDLDDPEANDPDMIDPLPTQRHREVP